MSEPAPEAPARTGGQGKTAQAKRGLAMKIGPLPLWAWGGLFIGGAAVLYFAMQGKGKKKQQQTAQPTQSAQPNQFGYPYGGMSAFPTTNPPPTSQTATATTTATTSATGEEGPGDVDKPGSKGKTGGWKGQHSNGQGSHHGKIVPPIGKTPPKTPTRKPANVPPKA